MVTGVLLILQITILFKSAVKVILFSSAVCVSYYECCACKWGSYKSISFYSYKFCTEDISHTLCPLTLPPKESQCATQLLGHRFLPLPHTHSSRLDLKLSLCFCYVKRRDSRERKRVWELEQVKNGKNVLAICITSYVDIQNVKASSDP